MPAARPSTPLRVLGVLVAAVGLAATFVLSLALGLWLHIDWRVSRRVARDIVNQVFRDTFVGTVRLGEITRISSRELAVATFTVVAPDGERAIDVEEVTITGPWLQRVLHFVMGGELEIPTVRIERGDVNIERATDLAIVRAFSVRPSPPPTEPPPPSTPFSLRLRDATLGHVTTSGAVVPGVNIDGAITEARVFFALDDHGLALDVDADRLIEKALVGATIDGPADYHLSIAWDGVGASEMWATLAADVGTLPLSLRAILKDDRLTAVADLPRIGPAELAPWVAGVPLTQPVAAHLELDGRLPQLDVSAAIALPAIDGGSAGTLSVASSLALDGAPEVRADVSVVHLDGRLVGAVPTDISARARLRARIEGLSTEIFALLHLDATELVGQSVPALEGTVRASAAGVDTAFRVDEPGAPTDLEVRYRFAGQSLAFAARSNADLAGLGRLAGLLQQRGPNRGTAAVTAEGSFVGGQLDVVTRAKLRGVGWPTQKAKLDYAVVDGRISGDPTALVVNADAHGGGLVVADEAVPTFAVSARGPLLAPFVMAKAQSAGREIAARGVLDGTTGSARGIQLDVTYGTTTVHTSVKRVASAPGGVAIEGLEVEGLGSSAVNGGLRVIGGELLGKLHGEGIDMKTVSRWLGLPVTVNGSVDLDLDLTRTPEGRSGHVAAKLRDGGVLVINGVQADVRVEFDGDKFVPSATVQLVNEHAAEGADDTCGGTIATVVLDEGDGVLHGPLLEAATWTDAVGAVRVNANDLKLRCVAELWQQANPLRDLPFRRIDGILNASAVLSRESRQRFPSLDDVRAFTTALVFESHPKPGEDKPLVVSERLDLALFAALDGKDGKTNARLHLVETASKNDLAQLNVGAELDLPVLLGGGDVLPSLLNMPLSVGLRTQRGAVSRWAALPEPVRTQVVNLPGEVEIDAFVEGSLRNPSAAIRVRAWSMTQGWGLATELDVLANYHGGVGRLDAKVRREGVDIATVTGETRGDLSARLFGGADPRWTGWAAIHLEGLPLEALPPLKDVGVAGEIAGDVQLRGLGDEPRITINLAVPKLRVGATHFVGAKLALEPVAGTDGMFTVVGSLPQEGGGGLEVRAFATLLWRDELFPRPDRDKPAGIHVVANRFSLETLRPVFGKSVERVNGRLDGEARLRYRELGTSKAALDVNMTIADGEVAVPGQEFTEISAKIRSKPSIITVDEISVTAHQGKLTGSLNARLDGLVLTDVTGSFTADAATPVPLVLDGVPLGTASGTVLAHYSPSQNEAEPDELELSVADLRLRLPSSSTADVQPLDDHPDVTISLPVGPPVEEEERRTNLQVTVALDKTILELAQARILISTSEPIVMAADGTLSGQISVDGGELNLLGKVFRFERGLVRLRPEESGNPYVNVTAYWAAANGTIVYVDYVGLLLPLSHEKITFRSTPALGDQEVLALLLLGDGGSAGSEATERASALSRGIAAAQFNAILGDIAPGLSTSFVSGDGFSGTTVIYQLSDEVTARATVEQADGTAAGTTGDSGTGNNGARTSVSIDWRFAPNWLLRGTLGVGQQSSSSLDVLYQFRY